MLQEARAGQAGEDELRHALEAATRELSAGGRYDGDVRYLRLWVQYVSIS
jgi:hypothetical protein